MQVIVTTEHVAEFYRFNQALAAFVAEGLVSDNGKPQISLTRLLGSVAQGMLHYMETAKEPLPPELQEAEVPVSDTAPKYRELTLSEVAYDRYAQFIETKVPAEVRKRGLAPVGPVSADIQERAAIACGLPVPKIPDAGDKDSLVTLAWLTARKNKIRAWQRIGALMFLASQTPGGMTAEVREELEQDGQAAIDYLYLRVEKYLASELKFAVLLGGASLDTSRKDLVDDEMLPDGGLGRHLFKEERPEESFQLYRATQNLRDDIEKVMSAS